MTENVEGQTGQEEAGAPVSRIVLIIQDNPETGRLDIAGVQQPQEFNPQSAAHVLGAFLRDNIETVSLAAGLCLATGLCLGASAKDSEPAVIGPERERTIVVPGDVAI